MPTLKKSTKSFAKVIPIEPKYILQKEAYIYCGMEKDLFRKESMAFGLTVYGRGPKKIWYKVSELDAMLESFLIIKGKVAIS